MLWRRLVTGQRLTSACPMSAIASMLTEECGPTGGGVTKDASSLQPCSCVDTTNAHGMCCACVPANAGAWRMPMPEYIW